MNRAVCPNCGYLNDFEPTRCAFCMEVIKMKVIIDPGHGGEDNGAAWGHAKEDDINLIVSFLLRCELEKQGHEVIMTREVDRAVSLRKRTDYANRLHVDLFISIHCDAFHNITVQGMSVHIHPEHSNEALDLAQRINAMLIADFKDHTSRGIRTSNFHVLRKTTMPAVLVECEFLSNPETRRFLREPENQLALARSISKGIV